jgi:2-keto-4-pentenoate hydratase/2-oxohepta-3-ene-1,7-dioic acid hydratase in catechol pathway
VRYLSFLDAGGRERAGVVDTAAPTKIYDLTDLLPDGAGGPMRRLIAATAGDHDTVEGLCARATVVDASETDVLPPVPDPTKVVAAPVNYRNHQSEMNEASHIDSLGVFLKAPSSVIGDGGVVRLPYTDRRFDQEGEFAAVIGRTARNVTEDEALAHVFGYTCLLDMTMRGGEDRSVRKSFDTFTPTGPTLVSPSDVPPIDDLELHLWVNGTLRQRADLKDLIWSLPKLIAYVSTVMTLYPGDIVTTGTPEGVGQVVDGDRIEVEVTGLDRLTVTVSAQGAVRCPTLGTNRGPVPPSGLTPVRERAR